MKPIEEKKPLMALAAILIVLASMLVSCAGKHKSAGEESDGTQVSANPEYVVMEKVLTDMSGRPRTTVKILVPKAAGSEDVSGALNKAMADIRKDDPSLKAAMIWAYRTRAELNGSNFTLGKLEWSADGKDFADQAALSPNPKLEIAIP